MTNQLYSNEKLYQLSDMVVNRIEDLLEKMKIKLSLQGNMYIGACPIHGGDNESAFNMFTEGHTVRGNWKCWTHGCEKVFKPTIIGFVRGMLSVKSPKYLWARNGDEMYPFSSTINWICNFLNTKLDDIKVDYKQIEKNKFSRTVFSALKNKLEQPKGIKIEDVRKSLDIPADYFIKRGYSPETLYGYSVGLSKTQGRELSNRVVVPILDDTKKIMVAALGRSIFPKCKECKFYHNPTFPCITRDIDKFNSSKWKNSGNVNSYLYNYWEAKEEIKKTRTVVIVEGPADVWKMTELGVKNCVALFGVDISDEQELTLESSGAMNIISLLDNDSAGQDGAARLKQKLNRIYRIFKPEYIVKDPGELNKDTIKPILELMEKL